MKKRSLALLLVLSLLIVGSFAASRTVQATVTNFAILLNGENISLQDANGNKVDPLVVNGTTYLPVRAIAENLDLDVRWEADTETIYLTKKGSAQAAKTTATKYPYTLTTYGFDKVERQLTIKGVPQKVFVDGKNNIDIMYALGLQDKIAGVCAPPKDYKTKLKAANNDVVFTEWKGSKEPVIALNPDFILGWYGLFYKDALGEVDYWHKKDINTYMSLNSGALFKKGESSKGVANEMQDILNVGKLFNKNAEAQALVAEIQAEIDKVQNAVAGKKPVTVAILEWGDKGYRVYGKDSLAGDMAIRMGGQLAKGLVEHSSVGAENIIAANPDTIMMIAYESLGTKQEMIEKITKDPKFASLKAVKNKRVYAVELSKVYASALETKDGLKAFGRAFYPNLYR